MKASWRERAERVLYRPFPPALREWPQFRSDAPWYLASAEGAWVTDVEGRRFLDLEMGRGPNLLGYQHPLIVEAAARGAELPAKTTLLPVGEVEVAELLTDIIPCAELAVFGRNGSDACTAAVRLARAATGRELILSCGFHGFHDWYSASCGWIGGIPQAYGDSILTFALNDFAEVRRLVEEHGENIAGIIIEPAHRELPEPGFLELLRALADQCGAILIFDEVVTSFRLARGGAQEVYGVLPDLACLGKAMGGGYPLSALVGKQVIMRQLAKTYFSMTYQHDALPFAVATACLRYFQRVDVVAEIRARGEILRQGFDDAAVRHGLGARALGFPGRLDFHFPARQGLTSAIQLQTFAQGLLRRGVLPTASAFPCLALSTADLQFAIEACDYALREVAQVLESSPL